jgi:hypothetical protein
VDVECYDGLGWLSEARTGAASDPTRAFVSGAGTVLAYYGNVSSGKWSDITSLRPAFAGTFSSPSDLAPGLTGAAVSPSGTVTQPDSTVWVSPGTAWSYSLWFTKQSGANGGLLYWSNDSLSQEVELATITGQLRHRDNNGFTTGGEVLSSRRVDDGALHHVVMTCDGTNAPIMYIDGVAAARTVTITYGASLWRGLAFREVRGDSGTTVQDLAVWQTALTAQQVADLYALGLTTFTETTTARAGRILDAVGWPSAWRDLTTEPYGTCTSPPFNGAQAINLLRDVERTEQGRLFAAKDGDITLQHRYFTTGETRGNTIQATFSDDGSDVTFSASGYDQDVDDVLNAVTVSLVSGASSESTNSTSITTYGRKSDTINTLLPNLDLALNMAQGVVLQRKDVLTRIRPVEPSIDQTAANWATVLGLEIGDRVRLEMTPSRTGSQLQQSATVEGISIEAHLSHTRAAFEAAPIPAVSWFVLGTSELDGSDGLAF